MKALRFVAGFVGMLAICALIVWAGGYNFDTRDKDVAFGLVMSLLISFVAGMLSAADSP